MAVSQKMLAETKAPGSRFVERIPAVINGLRRQGRDALDYLTNVCASVPRNAASICLLPDSS